MLIPDNLMRELLRGIEAPDIVCAPTGQPQDLTYQLFNNFPARDPVILVDEMRRK